MIRELPRRVAFVDADLESRAWRGERTDVVILDEVHDFAIVEALHGLRPTHQLLRDLPLPRIDAVAASTLSVDPADFARWLTATASGAFRSDTRTPEIEPLPEAPRWRALARLPLAVRGRIGRGFIGDYNGR